MEEFWVRVVNGRPIYSGVPKHLRVYARCAVNYTHCLREVPDGEWRLRGPSFGDSPEEIAIDCLEVPEK